MRSTFQVGADPRHDQGKGASRRLRRAGKVPAILYGGQGGSSSLVLDHQQLLTLIDNERFYSSIISLKMESQSQPAIVRDVQMHPARNAVVHVDLQRVIESEPLKIRLPLHFRGAANSPGVKTQGGLVHHLIQDVEVACLPADLPEFLELDLSNMNLNDTLYLADIALPAGVTIPRLKHGNPPVVSVHSPRVAEVETEAAAAAEGAAAAVPASEEAAKKEEPKKDDAKKEEAKAAPKKEASKKEAPKKDKK
ncbi:MAG TPA: 50S ribosomal protein L25/general stress protein Ctc [Steroidobacteraceae bacterium]|jgi:large subunit ribosomal protein L25|nr:50S ribosomal protein L25/general stress protein Ctc [Steroidobacteraceae bacterium]